MLEAKLRLVRGVRVSGATLLGSVSDSSLSQTYVISRMFWFNVTQSFESTRSLSTYVASISSLTRVARLARDFLTSSPGGTNERTSFLNGETVDEMREKYGTRSGTVASRVRFARMCWSSAASSSVFLRFSKLREGVSNPLAVLVHSVRRGLLSQSNFISEDGQIALSLLLQPRRSTGHLDCLYIRDREEDATLKG